MSYILHEKLENNQQIKPKESRRKEIIMIKAENNLKREEKLNIKIDNPWKDSLGEKSIK